MNRELRKAIYKKQMLRSKFEKYKTNKTWEAYRKQQCIMLCIVLNFQYTRVTISIKNNISANVICNIYKKGVKGITYILRKSIDTHFQERCTGGQKSKHFYTTVKPFLSKKSTGY
jgi:hypothetical protein